MRSIKDDPTREFCWSEAQIRENPKNFHAWEHRRLLANANLNYCDADTELKLTENILELDPKSYHAWQHRQWTVQTHKFSNFGLLTSEMKFTEKFLTDDVRNNSAWNERYFILKARGKIDFVMVKNEFSFVVEKIKIAFDNESAWSYLRGMLDEFKKLKKLPLYQNFVDFVEHEFYEEKNHNRHLIGFMIDAKIEMILESCESNELVHTQKVLQLCNLMADKYDKMRKNYWKFVYKKFYYDKIMQRHESNDSGGAKSDESWKNKIGKKHDERDESLLPSQMESKGKEKLKKKVDPKTNKQKANGFGTDLLFEIMNKYNQ